MLFLLVAPWGIIANPRYLQAQASAGVGIAAAAISVPTNDIANNIKEGFLDTIAWILVNAALSSIIISTTKWVNSGFEGKPAYVQDLEKTAANLEGEVVSRLLNEIENEVKLGVDLDGFFCGPFDQEIRRALRIQLAIKTAQPRYTQYSKCTIDSILEKGGNTLQNFENDFTKGGWPAWLQLTEPQNNRWGVWGTLQKEIWDRESEAKGNKDKELYFGRGFLSQLKVGECLPPGPPYKSDYEWPINAKTGKPDCPAQYKKEPDRYVTPGAIIQENITKTLGIGTERLKIADELDELIGSILNQFILKVFKGVGGLFGASKSSSGGKSLTDLLGDEAEAERGRAKQRGSETGTVFPPEQPGGPGEGGEYCPDTLDSLPASASVHFVAPGPYTPSAGERGAITVGIAGMEPKRFYKDARIEMDMRMPTSGVGKIPLVWGTTDSVYIGTGGRFFFEVRGVTTFLDGPGGPKSANTNWQADKDYHLSFFFDSQSNTITGKIFNKTDNASAGEWSIVGPFAVADIGTPDTGMSFVFSEEGFVFTNVSIDMEPGGPFHGGLVRACRPGERGGGGTRPPNEPPEI